MYDWAAVDQGTDEWFAIRSGKVTASRIADVAPGVVDASDVLAGEGERHPGAPQRPVEAASQDLVPLARRLEGLTRRVGLPPLPEAALARIPEAARIVEPRVADLMREPCSPPD